MGESGGNILGVIPSGRLMADRLERPCHQQQGGVGGSDCAKDRRLRDGAKVKVWTGFRRKVRIVYFGLYKGRAQ